MGDPASKTVRPERYGKLLFVVALRLGRTHLMSMLPIQSNDAERSAVRGIGGIAIGAALGGILWTGLYFTAIGVASLFG